MKKIYRLVFSLLLMLLLPSAVSALGSIAVSSYPPGALVLLDSIDKGVTPLTIDNVTIGAHNVLLMKPGYLNHLSSVTVMDGETVTLSITLTTTSSTPAISSITPSSASNSGSQTIVIAGTNFSGSTVSLTKSGQSTLIGARIGTDESTTLIRNFNLDGIATGTWNVEILNVDGGTVTGTFTVNSATTASISSISPTSGLVNTTVLTTISGTGFVPNSATVRLYRSGNYIIGTVNSGGTTTQLTGTFNLDQATPGAYDVCILPDGTDISKICSQTFTILSSASAANGSIYIQSSPTSSKVFLNNVFQGYTPMTLHNLTSGSTPLVTVRSAGYNEWSKNVAVTAGGTTTVTASLVLAPEVTTATTTVPTTTVTTVKTTVKSTAKVPTPWPSATPAPAASPVSIIAILGAVGVGFIVLRKW
jgi:hypothetical protein